MPVILSSGCVHRQIRWGCFVAVDPVEEAGVDGGESAVVTLAGVVALAQDDGRELGSGGEVDAGFAHGFELAVELDGTGAVAVAEQSALHLDP
jgi:hypothetical protein